jgi:transposase
MNEVKMIGVDLAKSVFQAQGPRPKAQGANATGEPVFRKKLSRGQFLKFLSEQSALSACDGGLRFVALRGSRDHEARP